MPLVYSYLAVSIVVWIVSFLQFFAAGWIVVQAPYAAWVSILSPAAAIATLLAHNVYYAYFGPPEAAVSHAPLIVIMLVFSILFAAGPANVVVLALAQRQNSVDQFLIQVPYWPFAITAFVLWPIMFLLIPIVIFAFVGMYKHTSFNVARQHVMREASRVVAETGSYNPDIVSDRVTPLPLDRVQRFVGQLFPGAKKYDYAVRQWWINHIEDNPDLIGLPPRF